MGILNGRLKDPGNDDFALTARCLLLRFLKINALR
jgi:hypothetical protein